jgi:lipocalin
MNDKVVYTGSNPDLVNGEEYTVKSMKRVCFSGPVNSGTYYLIEDKNEKDVFVHSREFKGRVCLLTDEQKEISDKRIQAHIQRMKERGFNPYGERI